MAQGDPATLQLVGRLQQDHLQMESRWVQARRVLASLAEGRLPGLLLPENVALDAVTSLYDAHIRAEEQIAYPAAVALLEPGAIAAIGLEMMQRRGAG